MMNFQHKCSSSSSITIAKNSLPGYNQSSLSHWLVLAARLPVSSTSLYFENEIENIKKTRLSFFGRIEHFMAVYLSPPRVRLCWCIYVWFYVLGILMCGRSYVCVYEKVVVMVMWGYGIASTWNYCNSFFCLYSLSRQTMQNYLFK
jgi:hypothetical protein